MATIRQSSGPESNYTMIHNSIIRAQFPPRMKVVYCYLRSHESGWSMSTKRIADALGMSHNTVKLAVRELEQHGYLMREQNRDNSGDFAAMTYVVLAEPHPPDQDGGVQKMADQNLATSGVQKMADQNLGYIRRPIPKKTKEDQPPIAPQGGRECDPLFESFWETYPKRTNRHRANTAWHQAVQSEDPHRIITAAKAFNDWTRSTRQQPRYIPSPANWLRDERWNDELPTPASNGFLDLMREFEEVSHEPPSVGSSVVGIHRRAG